MAAEFPAQPEPRITTLWTLFIGENVGRRERLPTNQSTPAPAYTRTETRASPNHPFPVFPLPALRNTASRRQRKPATQSRPPCSNHGAAPLANPLSAAVHRLECRKSCPANSPS